MSCALSPRHREMVREAGRLAECGMVCGPMSILATVASEMAVDSPELMPLAEVMTMLECSCVPEWGYAHSPS